MQNISFVHHQFISKLHTFVKVNSLFSALTQVNEVRWFVNILNVIYISFYSLTSRTCDENVELILKKKVCYGGLLCFGSYILQFNLISR